MHQIMPSSGSCGAAEGRKPFFFLSAVHLQEADPHWVLEVGNVLRKLLCQVLLSVWGGLGNQGPALGTEHAAGSWGVLPT